MHKQIIICIVIIVLVVGLDVFTQRYAQSSIDEINNKLNSYKEEVMQMIKEDDSNDEVNKNEKDNKEKVKKLENISKSIIEEFDKRYEYLAFYIEHEELEKIKIELINLESNVLTKEYEEAISDIKRADFLINHIKQKMSLQVKNIF